MTLEKDGLVSCRPGSRRRSTRTTTAAGTSSSCPRPRRLRRAAVRALGRVRAGGRREPDDRASTCSATRWRASSRGSARRRRRSAIVEQMVERHWGATMVLTEPDAGSDVGAGTHQGAAHRRTTSGSSRASSASSRTATSTAGEHRPHGARAARGRRRRAPRACRCSSCRSSGSNEDGIARRAQRRRLHEGRAEDGHQGLGDVRADVRRRQAVRAACSSARCTTASRRCSTSSSTRAWASA